MGTFEIMFLLFHTPPFQRVSRWILLGSLSFCPFVPFHQSSLHWEATQCHMQSKPDLENITDIHQMIHIKTCFQQLWQVVEIHQTICLHPWEHNNPEQIRCLYFLSKDTPLKSGRISPKKGTISIGNTSTRDSNHWNFQKGHVTCEFSREVRFDEDF